jgi:dihydrofolate synthase/folylpolyglutamate synthase
MIPASVPAPFDYRSALQWLDGLIDHERIVQNDERSARPTLGRIELALDLLGDPHRSFPIIRVSGTNGKTSTARMITQLLRAKGLRVGTFQSPHLERVNERIAYDGLPLRDEQFAEAIEHVATIAPLLEEQLGGERLTYFEATTAAALAWFADQGVDVGVFEVGIEGAFDATNVLSGVVNVATNVDLDHTNYLGPTRAHIAGEMASVASADGTLVLGETDPSLLPLFEQKQPKSLLLYGEDWECVDNELALGGRLLTIRTPRATYPEVFVPLHGAHQGINAATALVAVEAFFEAVIDPELVAEAMGETTSPGRMEIMGRHPLVIIDGAHNPAGAQAAGITLDEEFFGVAERTLVVGLLRGRDPIEFLDALGISMFDHVIATQPTSPRAMPAEELAAAAKTFNVDVITQPDYRRAVMQAVEDSTEDDMVFVTGSLYLVGAARTILR